MISTTTLFLPQAQSSQKNTQDRNRGNFNGGKEREREIERGEHEIEGGKEGENLNFEVCLTRLSFIKVATSVTHVSIYSLGNFLEKLP